MAQYTYHGDHAVDIPAFGLMGIHPGDVVEAPEIDHPDFQLTG